MIGSDTPVVQTDSQIATDSAVGACPQSRNSLTGEAGPVAKVVGWLSHLIPKDSVVELRALGMLDVAPLTMPDGTERAPTYAGQFRGSELESIAVEALTLSGRCRGVYYTLNHVRERQRQAPRMQRASRRQLATDADVIRRTRLLVDIDAVKPSADVPASSDEHAAALDHADRIRADLTARGWPAPAVIDTGNGAQLIYAIDLANTADATDLVRRVLQGLATLDGPGGRVDTSVYNAARITRLPGTLNLKGTPSADRPHRRCVLLDAPEALAVVSAELLAQVADLAPRPAPTAVVSPAAVGRRLADRGRREGDVIERARRYLATIPGAVSGQGGHTQTFRAASKLVCGYGLSAEAAYPLLAEWNLRCSPEWSESDLRRKLDQAARSRAAGTRYIVDRDDGPTAAPPVANDVLAHLLTAVPDRATDISDLADLPDASFFGGTVWYDRHSSFRCAPGTAGPNCAGCVPQRLVSEKPTSASENTAGTLSSTETKVVEESVPAAILAKLIGQPDGNYCPNTRRVGLEGHDQSTTYSAVALLRCRCWSKCAACREYDRHLVKSDNLPLVARVATHIFTGTAAEWDNLRTRLSKSKVKYATFAVSDGDTRTTVVAIDPDSPALIPDALIELRRVTVAEAVQAVAKAINNLPDRLEKGVRKFSPSHTWKLLLEHGSWDAIRPVAAEEKVKAEELKAMTPEERIEHKQAAKAAEEQAVINQGGVIWRRLEEVPLLPPDDVVKVLKQHGVTSYNRGKLQGNNVMDSVTWEMPVDPEQIEAIRKAIYEVSVVFPPLDELHKADDPYSELRALLA